MEKKDTAMSKDAPKKPSMAELEKLEEARLKAQDEMKAKGQAASEKAFSAGVRLLEAKVKRYLEDPRYRDIIANIRGDLPVETAIYRSALQEVKASEAFTKDPLATHAIDALGKPTGISAEALKDPTVAALNEHLNDNKNPTGKKAFSIAVTRINATLTAPKTLTPTKPTNPKSAAAAPKPPAALPPVAPGYGWVDEDDQPAPPPPPPAKAFTPPAVTLPAATPEEPNSLNFTSSAAHAPSGTGPQDDDSRSNADIQTQLRELRDTVIKLQENCPKVKTEGEKEKYQNLGTEASDAYLDRLQEAAKRIQTEIEKAARAGAAGGKANLTTTDANRGKFLKTLDEQSDKLNKALTDFAGAKKGIRKSLNADRTRGVLAGKMQDLLISNPIEYKKLDEALTPPSYWPTIKKVTSGVLATLIAFGGGGVAVNQLTKKPGSSDTPDHGALVKTTPPKNVEPPRLTPPTKAAEREKEEPKKEELEKEELKEVLPPPRAVVEADPKAPPKEIDPLKAKENPMGMTDIEFRALFEKKYLPNIMFASPNLEQRGYYTRKKETDPYKVNENCVVSYLPLDDVSHGLIVSTDGNKTVIHAPGNTELNLGIVQNPTKPGNRQTFHLTLLDDRKDIPLKNQRGEVMNFNMPPLIKNQKKFLTSVDIVNNKLPGIDISCYYDKPSDISRGHAAGIKMARFEPLLNISGRAFNLHAGAYLDLKNLMMNQLAGEDNKYVSGKGDPHDAHVVVHAAVAEPRVEYPKLSFTGYDNLAGEVVLNPKTKAGELQKASLMGLAHHFVIAGSFAPKDARAALGTNSQAPGHGIIYTGFSAADDQAARLTVVYGDSPPEFLRSGMQAVNTQATRAKGFIESAKGMLVADPEKVYTLDEIAKTYMVAIRVQAAAARSANEMSLGHGVDLEQGFFGEPRKPSLALGANPAFRMSTGIGTDLDAQKPEAGTVHGALVTEVQDLLGRAKVEVRTTQAKARETLAEAKKLTTAAGKENDPAEKAKILDQADDKERAAARLLGVRFPAKPLVDNEEAKDKAARLDKRRKAMVLMEDLVGKKLSIDMLKSYIDTIFLPVEKRLNDPTVDRVLDLEQQGNAIERLEDRKGLPGRKNPLLKFVADMCESSEYSTGKLKKDLLATHRDKSKGREIG